MKEVFASAIPNFLKFEGTFNCHLIVKKFIFHNKIPLPWFLVKLYVWKRYFMTI